MQGRVFDDFSTFAWEAEQDRRTLRTALAVAVLLHLGLMAVKLPEVAAAEAQALTTRDS